MRTLSIAVPCAKLGPCKVAVLAFAPIFVHFNEVDSSIHAAIELVYIHIQSELPIEKLEHLIGLLIETVTITQFLKSIRGHR